MMSDETDAIKIWRELSDIKETIGRTEGLLTAIQNENNANRDRFHKVTDQLQAIVLQLDPIYRALPAMQNEIQSFRDMKNKGVGVILAASAAGAILVEVGRFIWGVIPGHGGQ